MRRFVTVCVLILLIANAGLAPAAEKIRPALKTPQKDASKESTYSDTPFKLEGDIISLYYKGHDLRTLCGAFEEREKKKTKDEFETSEEFRARIQKEETKPLYGEIKVGDTLALSVSANTSYSADNKVLTITVPSERAWSRKWEAGIKGQKILDSTEKYIGTNVYGATAEITRHVISHAILAIKNAAPLDSLSDFPVRTESGNKASFLLTLDGIPVDKAKRLKDRVTALFVFAPDDPFIGDDGFRKKPTIDEPTEVIINNKVVFGKLKEIIAYDGQTGEILCRLTAKGNK